jgi:hypothetical protein
MFTHKVLEKKLFCDFYSPFKTSHTKMFLFFLKFVYEHKKSRCKRDFFFRILEISKYILESIGSYVHRSQDRFPGLLIELF